VSEDDDDPAVSTQDEFGASLPVANIRKMQSGGVIVELENGQVWRQLDSDNTPVRVPADISGLSAEVKPAFLGSVTMKINESSRTFRVARIN
jgi:hypothetical protein